MTPSDLQRLRELARAVTPGPWRSANGNGAASVVTEHPEYACQIYLNVRTCEIKDTVDRWQADARYIAAISPDVLLKLLDEIDGLRAKFNEQLPRHEWVAELLSLQQQLAAMTAARDEAAYIARRTGALSDTDEQDLAEVCKIGGP